MFAKRKRFANLHSPVLVAGDEAGGTSRRASLSRRVMPCRESSRGRSSVSHARSPHGDGVLSQGRCDRASTALVGRLGPLSGPGERWPASLCRPCLCTRLMGAAPALVVTSDDDPLRRRGTGLCGTSAVVRRVREDQNIARPSRMDRALPWSRRRMAFASFDGIFAVPAGTAALTAGSQPLPPHSGSWRTEGDDHDRKDQERGPMGFRDGDSFGNCRRRLFRTNLGCASRIDGNRIPTPAVPVTVATVNLNRCRSGVKSPAASRPSTGWNPLARRRRDPGPSISARVAMSARVTCSSRSIRSPIAPWSTRHAARWHPPSAAGACRDGTRTRQRAA